MVGDVSLQGAARGSSGVYPGHHLASVRGKRCADHPRGIVERPCPFVGIRAAKAGDQRSGAAEEGAVIPQGPAGVSGTQEALLG